MRADASRPVHVTRVGASVGTPAGGRTSDRVAVEEPLELRVGGAPFAVIMRTPGDDRALVAGFLFAERVIRRASDCLAIDDVTPAENAREGTIVDVTLTPEAARQNARDARTTVTSASCGVCGRATLAALRAEAPPVIGEWRVAAATLIDLPERLRGGQDVFAETGGLHAAALFEPDEAIVALNEDIGRHNAVDKVIGGMLLGDRLPLSGCGLFVSGRTSFDIVEKAWLAGIPLVAAVSAPSSLAVEMADAAGITLAGFVRGGGFNLYTHPARIV